MVKIADGSSVFRLKMMNRTLKILLMFKQHITMVLIGKC